MVVLKRMENRYVLEHVLDTETFTFQNKPSPLCPIFRNFECRVEHKFICPSCNKSIHKEEPYHDFSLDLLERYSNFTISLHLILKCSNSEAFNLQDLLHFCFAPNKIERKCEDCGVESENDAEHSIVSLPR